MPYNLRLVSYLSILISLLGIFLLEQPVQTNKNQLVQTSNTTPAVLAAASGSVSWTQTDFSGGVNPGPFTIPWGSSGGWNSYSSKVGDTITSSIFDAGRAGTSVGEVAMNGGVVGSFGTLMIRGADSVASVTSAPWQDSQTCNFVYRYFQLELLNSSNYKGIWIGNNDRIVVSGRITDAQTGKGISQATVIVNGVSGKTAFLQPGNQKNPSNLFGSFIQPTFAAGQPPSSSSGDYAVVVANGNGSFTVSASASGYNSISKTASWVVGENGCTRAIPAINISLTHNPVTSAPATNAPATPAPTPLALPATFMQSGSTSTNLSKITDDKNVSNLTLEIPKKNEIVFQENVDLSAPSTKVILDNLDKYVTIDKVGIVELDSKVATFLNKKAKITMFSLPYSSTPKVLVNGAENPKVVSDISYNNGTLTFKAAHFTKFEAVANISTTSTTSSKPITGLFVSLGLIFVAFATFCGGGYIYYKKKKKTEV